MMSVYFVSRIDDPSLVKIGHTDELDTRLQVIAGSFPDGIELVALAEGGKDVETAFHQAFLPFRVEGEWFRRTILIETVISSLKENVVGRRIFQRKKVTISSGDGAIEQDKRTARHLLQELMSAERAGTSLAEMQERAFGRLAAINPLWSRRRVRGIWEGAIRRVDFYEIRDLLTLCGRVEETQILERLAGEREAA